MKPRKVIDDFSVEESILEPRIVDADDPIAQPLEMFPTESRQTAAARRTPVLSLGELPLQRPPQSTALPISVARPRARGSVFRSVSAAGTVAILVLLAVIGGAAVRNRLDVSAVPEYLAAVRTTITPALRKVLTPREVARDSVATESTSETAENRPATTAETNRVIAPKKLESVQVPPPRPRQTAPVQQPTRKPAAAPPRPPAPSASRAVVASPAARPAPAAPPAPTVIERGEESPAPAITAATPSSAVPAVSPAAPAPAVTAPAAPAVSPVQAEPTVSSPAPTSVSAPRPAPTSPPPVAPSAPAAAGLNAETRAVALALNRYEDAFSALDVNAAHAVWPSVDVRALAKAFDQLEEQTFDLEGCNITVAGPQAEADCSGNARYVRKVGNRTLRVEPRRWHFKLRQTNDQWVIDAVDAR